MPVVSRIFSSHKYPSLYKSCECESLSLFVGVYPDHGVWDREHDLSGTLYPADHCSLFQAWVDLAQRMAYDLCFPSRW